MDPISTTDRLRVRQEQLMTASCAVTRRDTSTEPVWNPDTGELVQPSMTVYEGKCRLAYPSRTAADVEVAGATYAVSDYIVMLPLMTDVAVDDVIVINSSPDPAASPLTLVVERVPKSDWQVVRRADCREYTGEPT